MSKGSWQPLSATDLRRNREPLIRFYDELTEICGRLGPQIGLRDPIQLATNGHVKLFAKGNDLRVEVDEAMVKLIAARAESPLPCVSTRSAVEKVVGKLAWVGRDPRGKYEDYPCWYARKIGGRPRARILLRFPFVEANPKGKKTKAEDRSVSKAQRRMMRL